MLTIETLREYGANVEEGLGRCMNAEAFYLDLVRTVAGDLKTDELAKAIEDGDLAAAFDLAHALKGMCTNLALDPLSKPVVEITELLRARTEMDYSALVAEILDQKAKLAALV